MLSTSCGPSQSPPPNVLLIVFDALRPDHSGAYGYERHTTPNLDQIAEEGILFETATAPAAFTLPSMASLFTSLYPMQHGLRRHLDPEGTEDRLDDGFLTLAEILRAQGYSTAAVVSNSLFLLNTGFEQGFDFFNPGRRRDAGPTTEAAVNWLKGQPRNRPFFLWIHYIDPHWPYDAPQDFKRPFTHSDQGQFQRMVRAFEQGRLRSDQIYFENTLNPDGILRGIAEYDNEIAYADYHMGRLMRFLKQKDLYETTLIALVSDHGESLGEHGLFFAHSFFLYEPVQKVVMILKPPGWKSPLTVNQPVRLLDFLPTLLSLLRIEVDHKMEGVDLSPLWIEKTPLPDLPAYAESEPRYRNRRGGFRYPSRKRAPIEGNQGKWRMIRAMGYKLIFVPGEGMELYDLANDPKEQNNLNGERPKVATKLKQMLDQVMEKEQTIPGRKVRSDLEPDEEALRLIREMGY